MAKATGINPIDRTVTVEVDGKSVRVALTDEQIEKLMGGVLAARYGRN